MPEIRVRRKYNETSNRWIDIINDRARANQFKDDLYLIERLLQESINPIFLKIPIVTSDGKEVEEILLTNLDNEKFSLD